MENIDNDPFGPDPAEEMELLDRFALAALPVFLAQDISYDVAAERAYTAAVAMVKERGVRYIALNATGVPGQP